MIAYVKGVMMDILEDSVVVDVHGIGYKIDCANPYVFQSQLHENVLIHTYHHVREDSQTLYGFRTEEEKYLFKKLISVSGIGPKSGLAIQGSVDVNEFISAIEREDEAYLTSFPGVGKKTSRQIILDLKGQLTELMTATGSSEDQVRPEQGQQELQEMREALKALGYVDREIQTIIPRLQGTDHKDTDDLVREALALLMKK